MSLGCFSGPLVLVKSEGNAKAYRPILDNYMLSTLWQQFGEGPFLFQHNCASVRKVSSVRTRFD